MLRNLETDAVKRLHPALVSIRWWNGENIDALAKCLSARLVTQIQGLHNMRYKQSNTLWYRKTKIHTENENVATYRHCISLNTNNKCYTESKIMILCVSKRVIHVPKTGVVHLMVIENIWSITVKAFTKILQKSYEKGVKYFSTNRGLDSMCGKTSIFL